jgi:hypothetical protein
VSLSPSTGPKLTRASIAKSFTDDIQGGERLEYLMVYRYDFE